LLGKTRELSFAAVDTSTSHNQIPQNLDTAAQAPASRRMTHEKS